MKKLLKSAIATVALGAAVSFSSGAQACGTIEMGDFDWNSAKLHSAIATTILEEGYGCTVNVTTGSTLPIMTALYEGQLDVVMEVWYDNIVDQFKPYEESGKVLSLIHISEPTRR